MEHSCQSMFGRLRRVLVCRPGEAYGDADPGRWHYASRPDLAIARREHDALVEILRDSAVEVLVQDNAPADCADAVFVHDSSIVTDAGAILLNMGKPLRRDEPAAIAEFYRRSGVPVVAALTGDERAEGGDLLWLDERTLAIGQGFRTNAAGLRGLARILTPHGVDIVPVPLPRHGGPDCCLHLMSLVSVVDGDLAVVYPPLIPVPFWSELERRGFAFVEVPETEFASMGPNVLALAPRDCVVLAGNPLTRERLEDAGCQVRSYAGHELSLKSEGGPTCLTRPLMRERPRRT